MIRVGKIVATHGLSGDLIMTHLIGAFNWMKKDMPLFIEVNKNSRIPYFVSNVKQKNTGEYIFNIDGITTVEAGKKLIGKHVFIEEEYIGEQLQNLPLLWIGFSIEDTVKGKIGEISDVMQTGNQWIAQLWIEGKEVLIPLQKELIKAKSFKTKTLKMQLPDGLMEMYINK